MRIFLLLSLGSFALFLFISVPVLVSCARAEEISFADGRSQQGQLVLNRDGRLQFISKESPRAISLDRAQTLRFAEAPLRPSWAGDLRCVTLSGEQQLTGEFLGLSAQDIRFRTAWGYQVNIPRHAVRAIAHVPGFVTFLHDDFENGLKVWNVAGSPGLSARQKTSGQHSLRLHSLSRQIEYVCPAPLEAGRVGIHFFDAGVTGGIQWLAEVEFTGTSGPQMVTVVLGANGRYSVEAATSRGRAEALARTVGWHRLGIEFSTDALVVTMDDAPLWYSQRHGPGGPLRRVLLRGRAAPMPGGPNGEVYFDDFNLARAVPDMKRPPSDPAQDEVWLLGGDQLFGSVLRADRRQIEVQGRYGKLAIPWGEVRGIFPRREPAPPRTTEGEHVRVWIRAGAGQDQLEGTVASLDERQLRLMHSALGEVAIDREQLRQLRWLFHGRRLKLDDAPHHLGILGKLVPSLQPARAEGTSLRWRFPLQAVPDEARLAVRVIGLKGPGDGIVGALHQGAGRTEILVNGHVADYLNRHVQRHSSEPCLLRVALPPNLLRVGENQLEMRLTPDPEGHYPDDSGILGVTVEIPAR